MSPVTPNEFPPEDLLGPSLYATADDLRDELGLDAAALPDAEAWRLLEDACDEVDRMLGAWPVLQTGDWAGRKLDLGAWDLSGPELDALRRAAVKLAHLAHVDPVSPGEPRRSSVSGPDFSESYATGAAGEPLLTRQARTVLSQSGLVKGFTTGSPQPMSRARRPTVRRVR